MSFTDESPSFPHKSSEISRHLGVPDVSAVHLAIASLAERLLPLAAKATLPSPDIRITALRKASAGVLESLPWDCIAFEFCEFLGLPANQEASDIAYKAHRTDWLGKAIEQLNSEGVATPEHVRQYATHYGWKRQLESVR